MTARAAQVLTGPDAPAAAAALAVGLRVRLVFGLVALREKLLAWDAGLDDVDLELLKLAAMRAVGEPLARAATLRLVACTADAAVLLDDAATRWDVPRDALPPGAFVELRAALGAGCYVDLARLAYLSMSA